MVHGSSLFQLFRNDPTVFRQLYHDLFVEPDVHLGRDAHVAIVAKLGREPLAGLEATVQLEELHQVDNRASPVEILGVLFLQPPSSIAAMSTLGGAEGDPVTLPETGFGAVSVGLASVMGAASAGPPNMASRIDPKILMSIPFRYATLHRNKGKHPVVRVEPSGAQGS